MTGPRTDPGFFESLYASAEQHDPWNFRSDDYERGRYRTLLDHLPSRRFARCLEPGCSIGELSCLLAEVSDEVVALDVSPTAIRSARERHGGATIGFHVASFPGDLDRFPGPFDLVCLSEIGYYLDEEGLDRAATAVSGRVMPGGLVLAGHWTGTSSDHVLAGVEVHDILHRALTGQGFTPTGPRRSYPGFVVDLWQRPQDGPA